MWKGEDKYREKIRSEKDLFRQPQQLSQSASIVQLSQIRHGGSLQRKGRALWPYLMLSRLKFYLGVGVERELGWVHAGPVEIKVPIKVIAANLSPGYLTGALIGYFVIFDGDECCVICIDIILADIASKPHIEVRDKVFSWMGGICGGVKRIAPNAIWVGPNRDVIMINVPDKMEVTSTPSGFFALNACGWCDMVCFSDDLKF
jgi:hypothetical protein